MSLRTLALFVFALAFSISTALADRPHYVPPGYIISRSEARKRLVEFANAECPVHPSEEEHRPSRRTFKRAMAGDFDALTAVIAAADYHERSGDEYDGFSARPWQLLHVVGDQRFSAYLLSLDPAARQTALQWILVVRFWYSWHPLADYDGYLRRHFPRVAAIALAPAATPNHALQRTEAGGELLHQSSLASPASVAELEFVRRCYVSSYGTTV